MRITLTNDFHNSSVRLNADVRRETAYLTTSQVKRAKQQLCGVAGCRCSNDAGTRGRQALPNGERLEVNYDSLFQL